LLDKAATHKAHNPCCVVTYVAGEDNIVLSGAEYARADGVVFDEEINAIVELVVCVLGEVFLGHNRDTAIQDVGGNLWM
jgi:hypothetical protein